MTPLKVGVIGAGIMGEKYVQVYQADPRTRVVALANRSREKLDRVADRFEVPGRYLDYHAMLESKILDFVCVATPDHLHYAPVKACLEAGCHVLCEKPFTTDVAEADALCALVDKTGLKLQVAYNHRWLAPYYQSHLAIARGDIGEPVAGYARKNDPLFVATEMLSWTAESTPSLFLSGHDIDLMRWYFGSEPVEAHGYGTKKVLAARDIDTYDIIQAQVKFASGAYATFEACWTYSDAYPTFPDSFLQVIGTKGHLNHDRRMESMELTTESKYILPKTFLMGEIFGRLSGAFPACLASFVDCLINDTEPAVTARDGRQVTAALCAIDRAVRTGQTVAVE